MTYVNEKEELRKESEEEDTESGEKYTEEDQVEYFSNIKNFYEKYTIFVKLAVNNYFSNMKRKGQIKESDAEEFSKSENTEEFQSMKMRVQNNVKEDLLTNSDNDFFNFALNSLEIYSFKLIGLFD